METGLKHVFLLVFMLCGQAHMSNGTKEGFKCNQTLGQTDPLKDGTCPEMTRWNQDSGCCVQIYELIKENDLMEELQGDSPHYCDASKGYIQPLWDKTCPHGKGLDREIHCCVPCLKCAPGYELGDYCLEPCRPCPPHHYSNEPAHNDKCLPCVDCRELHRYFKEVCGPTAPAKCGQCVEGYHEPTGDSPDDSLACEGSEFETFVVTAGQHEAEGKERVDSVQGTEPSRGLDLQIPMMILLVILTLVAVVGFVVWMCDRHKSRNLDPMGGHQNNSKKPEEEKRLMAKDNKHKTAKREPSVEEEHNVYHA